MTPRSGEERILLSLSIVSIHGAPYADVVLGDPEAPADAGRMIRSRIGPESIEGDPVPGDRVRVEGFLGIVLRIIRVAGPSEPA